MALHVLVCVTQHFIARRVGAVLHVTAGVRVTVRTRCAHIIRHVVVHTAHDGVTLRVRSRRVVPGLIFLPGDARHARVILHAHVRRADDWIALRVCANILIS